ncbi:MAG: transposase [Nitrospinae bacterium]|nr:transposase [Nitrospinota bacterium]
MKERLTGERIIGILKESEAGKKNIIPLPPARHYRACCLAGIAGSTFHYEVDDSGKDDTLRKRMRELAARNRRFGLPRLHAMLRAEGLETNHKRSERIYHEEGLSLRTKRRNRKMPALRKIGRRSIAHFLPS